MKYLLTIILSIFINSLFANTQIINIEDRINTQNFYKTNYNVIFSKKEFFSTEAFAKALDKLNTKDYGAATKFIESLDNILPKKILMPFIYWKFVEKNYDNAEIVLSYLYLYKLLIIRDFIDTPIDGSDNEKNEMKILLKELTEDQNTNTLNLFSISYPQIKRLSLVLSRTLTPEEFINITNKSKLATIDLSFRYPYLPDYSLSYLGLIPGNYVELISDNKRDPDRIKWLNERVIFNGGKLDYSQPYMTMPMSIDDPNGHICFKEDPIYMKIRDMIDSAKESIFVDIFLFGGTLGGTIAKFLIDQTIEKRKLNPNFRTLMLHDYATNYNMKEEMMPVFEYIRDRIENARKEGIDIGVSLLQANIQRHNPGIPLGITSLIPKTDEVFNQIEKNNTYFESKIDHSKVIVVDANTDFPQAYFGSKNWTDHSGGYYYDNTVYLAGPVAALVQASYYDDVEAALTLDEKEQKWFYYKEQGFDNKNYLSKRDEILNWMKVKRSAYPQVGNDTIRLNEANVDGRIKDTRNMLIDIIKNAEQHIYMEQLFIYDKYVIDALIKRKIERPNLEIKIIADHNGNFGMNGLPNSVYMKEMADHGIELKARNTLGITCNFPNGSTKKYHQENHRKITSVDSMVILAGSSNINPDTLQGSLREFGAELFNRGIILNYEKNFLEDWNNSEKTSKIETDNFNLKVLGLELNPMMSDLLHHIAGTFFRFKDTFEGRH